MYSIFSYLDLIKIPDFIQYNGALVLQSFSVENGFSKKNFAKDFKLWQSSLKINLTA